MADKIIGLKIERVLRVRFSYDQELQIFIKEVLGGRYVETPDGDRYWEVDARHEERLKAASMRTIGHDGEKFDQVNVRLTFEAGANPVASSPYLSVGGVQLLRSYQPYVLPNVFVQTGEPGLHPKRKWPAYFAPESDHGIVVVGNVARQRALQLREKARLGQMRKEGLLMVEIQSDSERDCAIDPSHHPEHLLRRFWRSVRRTTRNTKARNKRQWPE